MKMSKKFVFLSGDINWKDHGGSWVRFRGARDAHVISLHPIDNHEETGMKYYVSLGGVHVPSADDEKIVAECGGDVDMSDFLRVDWLYRYGSYAPLGEFSGNNYKSLMKSARARSRELDNEIAEKEAMERPVNLIGSTALEYQRGDLSSAILRGLANASPEAELMAKMGMLHVKHVGDGPDN